MISNKQVNFLNIYKLNFAKLLLPSSLLKSKVETGQTKPFKCSYTDRLVNGVEFEALNYFKLLFLLSVLLISGMFFAPTTNGQEVKEDLNVVPTTKDPVHDLMKQLLKGEPGIDILSNNKK